MMSVKKTKLKTRLVCRECFADWEYRGDTVYTVCPHCGKKVDARDRSGENRGKASDSESLTKWRSSPENRSVGSRANYIKTRRRAFFRVCGSINPKCVRCGCDDIRLLEINHKTLVGKNRQYTGKGFLSAIINGKHPTDNLELLCRPCNAIHYLEQKLGESLPMKVVWSPTNTSSAE